MQKNYCHTLLLWRGARVAEWAGFENQCAGDRTVGSNPTFSVMCKELVP